MTTSPTSHQLTISSSAAVILLHPNTFHTAYYQQGESVLKETKRGGRNHCYMDEANESKILESYDEVIAETIRRNATLNYGLHQLLKSELKTRTLRAIQSRIRAAKFPEKKDIDNFIFTATPISQEQIMHLYSCEFVNSSRNIVLIGGTGTGKTHLAIAISARAVRKGYKSKFFNLVDLANQLGSVDKIFNVTILKLQQNLERLKRWLGLYQT
ncbi:ATP-binding protein [Candidatus Tisiphia endosymbiont of Dioctria rufipes]|uniref:ATP-binding protein n=2 Tax=unclassified Candidatus Tisiphia TaxID=2996318 RepID=UPI00312CA68B